jgi:molecular chaperone HscB
MTSQNHVRTIQECRTCGGGAPIDAHFCPQCTKILTLGRQGDYFTFMGLPRKLNIDTADLERRFRSLSRQFHPDFFYNATPAERRASLERSSYLNDAYRTLKTPIARIAYLLDLEGVWTPADRTEGSGASKLVPPALLEEVFALNEELDEVRELRASGGSHDEWAGRLQNARRPIDEKRAEHERQIEALSARWDSWLEGGDPDPAERAGILKALRELMLERNYITNLLAGIERELSQ